MRHFNIIISLIFFCNFASGQCEKFKIDSAHFFDLTGNTAVYDSLKINLFKLGKYNKYQIWKKDFNVVSLSYAEGKSTVCIKNSKCVSDILNKTITLTTLDKEGFDDIFFKKGFIGPYTPDVFLVQKIRKKIVLTPLRIETGMLFKE